MEISAGMIIIWMGAMILFFAIPYFLRKDYQLNGTKRIMTSSKYGSTANTLSLILMANLVVGFGKIHEQFIGEQCAPAMSWFLYWIGRPILILIIVASIYIKTYVEAVSRKKFSIKYDNKDSVI
jgi:high-affinity Fe2+/Pb2+ permease